MGCRPCGPRFFVASGFPFSPSSLCLVGREGFLSTIGAKGASTPMGEKQGFMTSVVALASQN